MAKEIFKKIIKSVAKKEKPEVVDEIVVVNERDPNLPLNKQRWLR